MESVALKLEGPHEVILGDFRFFREQTTCALSFFSESIWSSSTQPSPCPKGKKNPTQIEHHM